MAGDDRLALSLKRELAQVVYASDGDMSWRDEFTVVMGSKDGGVQVRVRGNLLVADDTRGVVSELA